MGRHDWTPARGWQKALFELAIRSPVVLIASLLAGWALHATAGDINPQDVWLLGTAWWMLAVFLGALVGMAEGYFLTWNLTDRCGLKGKSLLWVVYLLLVFLQLGAYKAFTSLCGRSGLDLILLFMALFLFALLMAGRGLWLDT